jgi:hypothetical protein
MHDHLGKFEEEIGDMATRTASDVEEAALLWRITTHMTLKLRDSHPDWLFYRYEDLACDPSSFREIYDALDLPFTGEVRSRIARATNPNTAGWRRSLSPAEVDSLHSLVSDRSTDPYPDQDWTG